jgi:AraC-like DNA-binding protein
VADVVCAAGPRDRPFEEQHSSFAIAIVAAGTFRYRGDGGSTLMTPGSLMLGSAGQCYECGHEHGNGDRCVSFGYEPAWFERLAADAGARGPLTFQHLRVASIRELSPLVATACAGISGAAVAWDELSIRLASATIRAAAGSLARVPQPSSPSLRRVAAIVRAIERNPDRSLSLTAMARAVDLSPFHFLRTFEQVTGTTPHQYVLRARLREAARRMMLGDEKAIDVALACGFSDASRFSHAFRAEFGVSPRTFRRVAMTA